MFVLRCARRSIHAAATEAVSDTYWAEAVKWYAKYDQFVVKQLYETLAPFIHWEDVRRILDVNAGIGEGAEVLLKHADPHTSFVLTSSSRAFVDAMTSKQLERCECLESPTDAQPFPGEFFDLVLSLSTASRLENPYLFFREAYRLLSPTGVLAFSVLGSQNGASRSEVLDLIRDRFQIENPFLSRKNLSNPGKVKATLRDVGFRRVVTFHEHFIYPTTDLSELKTVFVEEPSIRALCNEGHQEEVDKILQKGLHTVVDIEGAALNYESLIVIAAK